MIFWIGYKGELYKGKRKADTAGFALASLK